jgi:hypothetical protein
MNLKELAELHADYVLIERRDREISRDKSFDKWTRNAAAARADKHAKMLVEIAGEMNALER